MGRYFMNSTIDLCFRSFYILLYYILTINNSINNYYDDMYYVHTRELDIGKRVRTDNLRVCLVGAVNICLLFVWRYLIHY